MKIRRFGSGLVGTIAATCILAAVSAASAGANARVSLSSGGQLGVTVEAVAGADGNHGILVEPFHEANGRNGWRVRQDQFGRPAFSSSDSDCFVNGVVNDVVCTGSRSSIAVTGGDGADVVLALETPAGIGSGSQEVTIDIFGLTIPIFFAAAGIGCDTVRPGGVLTVDLGGGADVLGSVPDVVCAAGFFPVDGFLARLDAEGGSGGDSMDGSPGTDTLEGESGNDRLDGGAGNDTLDGGSENDDLSGAGGNDTLRGGLGVDELFGNDGDDQLDGGPSGDVLNGGPGFDTVTYAAGNSIRVTIGAGGANDGQVNSNGASEGDDVSSTVERVVAGGGLDVIVGDGSDETLEGGSGLDNLTGSGGEDRLEGGPDDDRLEGNAGDDSLFGQDGNDSLLDGGTGADLLSGGAGNDFLRDRDGTRDTFQCGAGTDTAIVDLADAVLFCETVDRAPVDDGPPSHALQPLRLGSGGTAFVRVVCPRAARIACRGSLTLRTATRRFLARGRYDVGVGETDSVQLQLGASAVRTLRGRVIAETRERGVSKKGPRSSSRLLRVERG